MDTANGASVPVPGPSSV